MKYAPYSYSKIGTFQQCPLKYKFQYIDKVPVDQAPSPAIERGLAAHKFAEDYFTSGILQITGQFPDSFVDWLTSIDPVHTLAEFKLGVTEALDAVEYDDPSAFIRGIADVIVIQGDRLTIYDLKTGSVTKNRKEVWPDTLKKHRTQCGLYAEMVSLALHELFDMDQPVESAPYYMDLLGPQPEPVPVDESLPILNRIKKNCLAVEQCVSFPARPNRFCGWCPYSKSNGGPCKL